MGPGRSEAPQIPQGTASLASEHEPPPVQRLIGPVHSCYEGGHHV